MSQARSSWQQTFDICRLLIKDKRFRRLGGQAICVLVFALLWCLNWRLFLATSVGIAGMSFSYLAQNPHWQNYCQRWRKFFVGSNRQLALAVGTGASGAFGTYLAASVWADTDNQWLATGSILQGLMSLTTLIVVLWSLRSKKANTLEAKVDLLLLDLSDRDRLKRLVAIRQLTRLLVNNHLSAEHYQQSIEYYQLMLSEPQPAVIKDALLDSLDLLGAKKILQQPSVVKIPLQIERDRQPILDTSG
ncbi:MAG: ATP synthase subunit I [Cyanobacteria bacterium J06600_6]